MNINYTTGSTGSADKDQSQWNCIVSFRKAEDGTILAKAEARSRDQEDPSFLFTTSAIHGFMEFLLNQDDMEVDLDEPMCPSCGERHPIEMDSSDRFRLGNN
jgi:hypothetical protein